MKQLYLVILCLFFYVTSSAQGQSDPAVTVNFQQAGIEQVVRDIESKTGYRFYYDAAAFDSLRVTLQLNQQPLTRVLDEAFANTSFTYAITNQRQVFLTKGRKVQTELADGFFSVKAKPGNSVITPSVTQAFATDEKEKSITEATIENKTYEIGAKTNTIGTGNATIAGYIKDIKTGEPVSGASLFVADAKTGVNSDQFGFFSITMPKGSHTITIRALGSRDTRRQIMLYSDGKLNIDLQEQILSLKEVKISADKIANVKSLQVGAAKLDIKSIKEIPAVFGEADVLRAILVLPGVQSVGEATTGFNVRGGSADQNLVLLDGMTIYNPAHFFGFFSAFNPEIVKDVELYKSSIPERFGGRLSSVLEVTDREGSKKQITGSAGIGLLTSRLNLEGPLGKDGKTSFIFGGRTTYSDWLLSLLPEAYKHSKASFSDINLDINHQIDDKNTIYLYSYFSTDYFKLNSDTAYSYSNKNASFKWKHTFNNKLYSVIGAGFDRYQYSVGSQANPILAYKLAFNMNQTNVKADFNYYPNNKHAITFGLSAIYYDLHPGNFQPDGAQSLAAPNIVPAQYGLESGLYAGDKFDVTDKFSISAGVRLSIYNSLGPATVNYYAPGLPKASVNVADSVRYGSNQVIKTYFNPEVRLSARYSLSNDLSVKAAYNTLHQYIHLLSNTTAISPTDVYQLSNPNIKPQSGDQVSFGLYKNMKSNTIETSVEVYYKRIHNYLDYKSGATLELNHNIETDVINTNGKAYGVEFMLRKTAGKLTGIMSYTYSRTFLKQDDPTVLPLVNNGSYYPANYDKPHDFNLTGSYHVSHRYSFSFNTVYSTGRPITLPIAGYNYDGSQRVYYSDRNQYRIPDYFRMDFSINIEGNHRIDQLTHNSWTIGVYNLTGRQNAYSTFFTEQGGVIGAHQLSIFAAPIPFVNYNIRF